MAKFVFLGFKVAAGAVARLGLAGKAFGYGDAGLFELADFVGIVGEQADAINS